jgi:hypothetical protein
MLFTAAVALLSAGARALRETPHRIISLTTVWALCFVAVGLVALWAALGNARPLRRGPVVFALSPVLGVFFAFAAGAHRAGWFYIILTMLLFPAFLLGSLLVVRSCGYRIVRRAGSFSGPEDGDGGRSPCRPGQTGIRGTTMRSILDLAERDPPAFEVGRSTVDVVCSGDNIGFGQVRFAKLAARANVPIVRVRLSPLKASFPWTVLACPIAEVPER